MAKEYEDKRKIVEQKGYLGLVAPQLATKAWANDKAKLHTIDPKNKSQKDSRMKVKQKDLMTLVNMRKDNISEDSKHKSLVKSTTQRRELFIDGYQLRNQDLKKRIIFSSSDMDPKQKERFKDKETTTKLSAKVKRFYASNDVSSHTLPKYASKCGRRRLYEENPTDLGAVLHDRLKNWSPHIGSNLKGKLSFVSGTSKSYDLLKGKGDEAFANSMRPKKSSASASTEIYISLEKKSLQEKKDYIKQSKATLFNDYVELYDSTVGNNVEASDKK